MTTGDNKTYLRSVHSAKSLPNDQNMCSGTTTGITSSKSYADVLKRNLRFGPVAVNKSSSLEDNDRDALIHVIRILSNENQTLKEQVKSLSRNQQHRNYADVRRSSLEDDESLGFKKAYMMDPQLEQIVKTTSKVSSKSLLKANSRNVGDYPRFEKTNSKRKSWKKISPQRKLKECKFCGTTHIWGKDMCSAYGHKCKICCKHGHFERACFHKEKRLDNSRSLPALKIIPESLWKNRTYKKESIAEIDSEVMVKKETFEDSVQHDEIQDD